MKNEKKIPTWMTGLGNIKVDPHHWFRAVTNSTTGGTMSKLRRVRLWVSAKYLRGWLQVLLLSGRRKLEPYLKRLPESIFPSVYQRVFKNLGPVCSAPQGKPSPTPLASSLHRPARSSSMLQAILSLFFNQSTLKLRSLEEPLQVANSHSGNSDSVAWEEGIQHGALRVIR